MGSVLAPLGQRDGRKKEWTSQVNREVWGADARRGTLQDRASSSVMSVPLNTRSPQVPGNHRSRDRCSHILPPSWNDNLRCPAEEIPQRGVTGPTSLPGRGLVCSITVLQHSVPSDQAKLQGNEQPLQAMPLHTHNTHTQTHTHTAAQLWQALEVTWEGIFLY